MRWRAWSQQSWARHAGATLSQQPPYAPEATPVERIFEELRRAKIAIVKQALQKLALDTEAYAQPPPKTAYS